MTRFLFAILISVFAFSGSIAQTGQNSIALIPQPASLIPGSGNFVLQPSTTLYFSKNSEIEKMAAQFAEQLSIVSGRKIIPRGGEGSEKNSIHFVLGNDKLILKEGYRLKVDASQIVLTANEPAGIFYGIQTLLQLFPPEIMGRSVASEGKWMVPAVTIADQPRFGWRGIMLDVARHFFTVEQVKQYIDEMARYKFNILHLHLSDDQGWRIEIKSLPKLTSVGAWRVDKTGTFGRFSPPTPDEPRTYGGFYTQEQMKDIIAYAKSRYINILPEIDIPGHSMAAIASYPELSCTPGNYPVNSGEQLMVWPPGGHFYGKIDNSLCPANEKVYEFVDKVFSELAVIFPFEYIHMGGDETARNFWEKSSAIKALMEKEKLKNLDEVQSYFVKRVERIISSKGKKLIGWDEILQGGLAPNAAVMSWRGMKGGIQAATQGHEVVMSPSDFAYIDYMQGDASIEPPVYASLRLSKTYQFEPVPDGVNPSLIKGGQANLWTEQIYNMRHAQYMTWPRAFAIAEILWSPKSKKDWKNFIERVEAHFKRFDIAQIKYAPSIYDPIIEASKKDSTLLLKLSTEIEGLDIHYSFDNSFPDNFYPKYTTVLSAPKDAVTFKLITYRNGKPAGRMIVVQIAELKKRAGFK